LSFRFLCELSVSHSLCLSLCLPLCLSLSLLSISLSLSHAQSLMKKTQQTLFNQLLQCRLRCRGSCYLMGLPDPTLTLASDEVYVPGWCSCHCRADIDQLCHQTFFTNSAILSSLSQSPPSSCLLSEILVSRFPLHSSQGIRKLKLVNDCFTCATSTGRHELVQFFNPHGQFIPSSVSGGVIIFGSNPTLTSRYTCPVVSSLSGDYDGDLYWVCTDERLVKRYREVEDHQSSGGEMSGQEEGAPSPVVSEAEGWAVLSEDLHSSVRFLLPDEEEEFEDQGPAPLIQSNILLDSSPLSLRTPTRLTLPNCQYFRLLSLSLEAVRTIPPEDLMEGLLWEGLTPLNQKHFKSKNLSCSHSQPINQFLKFVASSAGIARSSLPSLLLLTSLPSPNRCEQLWQIKADLEGVESEGAKLYHELHDKLLSSRKNGYYLSGLSAPALPSFHTPALSQREIERLLSSSEHLSPHYLVKGNTPPPSSSSSSQVSLSSSVSSLSNQCYHSTSALGKLFDLILELLSSVPTESRTHSLPPPPLDVELQINFEVCCCTEGRGSRSNVLDDEQVKHLIDHSTSSSSSPNSSPSVRSLYLQAAHQLFSRSFICPPFISSPLLCRFITEMAQLSRSPLELSSPHEDQDNFISSTLHRTQLILRSVLFPSLPLTSSLSSAPSQVPTRVPRTLLFSSLPAWALFLLSFEHSTLFLYFEQCYEARLCCV
jgi:hypothetical protein